MSIRRRFQVLIVTAGLAATVADAEILVLKAPGGQIYITNLGERAGYKVISRHREFHGSSGMGLRSAREGNSTAFEVAIREASSQHALDFSLVKAVIRAESNFDQRATSIKGAMGLMQLMPSTARQHDVRNAYDPVQNIQGGTRHLRYLMDRYQGNLDLVLAAYNAGTKPVDAVRGIPSYAETREYVRRVRDFHGRYRSVKAVAPPAPTQVLAKLNLWDRRIEEIYGVPIVLRGAGLAVPVP